MSTGSSTPFVLGNFVGNANSPGSSAEATFDAQNRVFDSLMGATPIFQNTYIDFTQAPSAWLGNTSWSASVSAASPTFAGSIPVIGLPMGSTSGDAPSSQQILENFANGTYDSMLQGMVKVWAADGFMTQYWRPGVEMNLNSTPGFVGSSTSMQALWVSAFQHIYTTLHAAAAADGVKMNVIWNPGIANYSAAGNATATLWPGAHYVDTIGADVYADLWPMGNGTAQGIYDWAKSGQMLNSPNPVYDTSIATWAANPINLEHYYTYPASDQYSLDASGGSCLSLQDLIDFAKTQCKPLAVCETGAGNTGDGAGLSDNPTFVQWLSSTLEGSSVPISYVNIWDDNGGGSYEFTDGSKPLEAAAWAKYFGAQSTSTGTSPPVAPHAASAADTQLAGTTGTIYDTSGNAWTITGGQQIAENGTIIPSSAEVSKLLWTGTALDQENTSGSWWTQPLNGLAGTELSAAPAGYAAPVSPIAVTLATKGVATIDPAAIKPFTGVLITDANAGQTETATVSLSAAVNGVLSDPNVSTDHSTIANGVLTVSGSATAVATDLDGLVFTPSSSSAPIITTTVTAQIKDTDGETASATSTVTATHAASLPNTQVTGTSGTIHDTSGNAWTITSGQQIAENGVVVPSSAKVSTLFWTGKGLDQLNTSGSWWTQPLNGSAGTELSAAPAGYVAPATPITITSATKTVSTTDPATVKPFTAVEIKDANVGQSETATVSLSATADGVLSDPNASTDHSTIANGVLTVSGSATAVAADLNGVVFTPSSSTSAPMVTTIVTAQIKDSAGETASATSTITATHAESLADTQLSGTSGTIHDTSGNAWTITSGQQIAENGTVVPSSAEVSTLFWTGKGLDQLNTSGSWWTQPLNGSAGTELSAAPAGYTAPAEVATLAAAPPASPDTLALQMSEDAYNGDAQFTVSVDGKQVGGDYTASALHSSGDAGTFLLTGEWGTGANDVQVSFINAANGGTAEAARNLYVNSISENGMTYAGTTANMLGNSTDTFAVGGTTPTASAPADNLTMNLSEDAWQGNADFVLYIDGKAVTTPQVVSALHDAAGTQAFSFTGDLGAGKHTIGIGFTNDAYGGSASADRNLYINGITLNGTDVFSGAKAQDSNGISNFNLTTTH